MTQRSRLSSGTLLLALALGACSTESQPPEIREPQGPWTKEETARHTRAVEFVEQSKAEESQGRIDVAGSLLQKALTEFKSLGARDDEIKAEIILGCFIARTGNLPQGGKYLDAAEAQLLVDADPALRSILFACRADTLSPPRSPHPDPERAARLYDEAIRLASETRALGELHYAWNGLGNLRVHRVDFAGARQAYQRALEASRQLSEPRTTAVTLHNLAWCHLKENDLDAACKLFQEALAAAEELEDTSLIAEAAGGLGRVAYLRGDLREAWRQLERTLELAEKARARSGGSQSAASVFANVQDHFEMAQNVLLSLDTRQPGRGHQATAFAVSQRARARWLLDVLPKMEGEPTEGLPVPLAEVRRDLLDDDTLLLQLDLGEAKSHLWAISRREVEVFSLPAREQIEPLARELYDRLADQNPSAQQPHIDRLANDLGRLLLAPVSDRLATYSRLLMAVEGPLLYVPFEILAAPGSGRLVATHAISYSASPSVSVRLARRPAHSPGPAAVLYDPVFNPDDVRLRRRAQIAGCQGGPWKDLPQTAREAAALLKLLPPGRIEASGTGANKALVTSGNLEGAGLIHFGTHAVFVAGQPDRSGIVLSCFDTEGRPQAPLLTVPEIRRLRLSAELVVMSACDSALGDEVRGEGLIGLAHAFFQAGARRTVGSIWKVRDNAAAELMTRFYRGLLAESLSPAAALARAKRELAQDPRFREPYFWAGFVLQGPPDRAGYTKAAGRGSAPASRRPHSRGAGR